MQTCTNGGPPIVDNFLTEPFSFRIGVGMMNAVMDSYEIQVRTFDISFWI